MDSITFVIIVLGAVFVGKIWGGSSEMAVWVKAAIERKPVTKRGVVFTVECLGEEEEGGT